MNERQQQHIDFFNERLAHYLRTGKERWTARLLAADDADKKFPFRTDEECAEVVAYLHGVENRTSDE